MQAAESLWFSATRPSAAREGGGAEVPEEREISCASGFESALPAASRAPRQGAPAGSTERAEVVL